MSSGIHGRCDCPLGRHHADGCPNYIDVWRNCPCPECTSRRIAAVALMNTEPDEAEPIEAALDPFGDDEGATYREPEPDDAGREETR